MLGILPQTARYFGVTVSAKDIEEAKIKGGANNDWVRRRLGWRSTLARSVPDAKRMLISSFDCFATVKYLHIIETVLGEVDSPITSNATSTDTLSRSSPPPVFVRSA